MADGKAAYKDNTELAVLAASGDEAACAELVEKNMGLVRSAVQRFLGRGCEAEDLMQLGCMGLVKAARSFDGEKGCAFSTYAVPLIMGEIKRYLRDNGQIKVSRTQKRLGAMLLRESERLYITLGREEQHFFDPNCFHHFSPHFRNAFTPYCSAHTSRYH